MSPEQTIALPHSHALLCRWTFNVEQSATVFTCCAIAETHNTSNAAGRTDFIKLVLIISPNDTATWSNWSMFGDPEAIWLRLDRPLGCSA
jgi:hypothetical protein